MSIPGSALPLLLASPAGAAGAENRSLRFNSADNAYLNFSPSSASNQKTWTWSGWIKRTKLGTSQLLFYVRQDASNIFKFEFTSSDTLFFEGKVGGTNTLLATTSRVFRDPSAWYHLVVRLNASSTEFKVYVNGVEETLTSVTGPSNQNYIINSTAPHYIGGWTTTSNCDFYLAEVAFVDGSVLSPTSFGEFDATTGAWNPIDVTGLSFGTNGYLLTFADNSSAAALGYDAAGSNDWTVNNISVTAGADNDSLADSPYNGDTANDTGLGNQVSGNYATLNPLQTGSNTSLANGNLDFSNTATEWNTCLSTIFVSSGKWYCETVVSNAAATTLGWGIAKNSHGIDTYLGATADGWALYGNTTSSYTYTNGSTVNGSYCTLANNDVLGMALDMDAGTLTYYVNNVSQGTAFSGITGSVCFAVTAYPSGATSVFNFGQRAFEHSAPSGFKAVCTANLDTPTIEDGSTVMDAVLYDGNGSTQTISGLNFSPDLVWLKSRSDGKDHSLQDTVRGAGNNRLRTNQTGAENTQSGQISSFNSDGWTMGDRTNESGQTYVGWAWDAGSSTVSNTSGSITSTVRANISAGFSVLTYTGTGSNATVGHGLGIAPQFIVIKDRDVSTDWMVYHESLGNGKYLNLNLTAAAVTAVHWQNTSPTSSVFSIGTSIYLNNSDNHYVAYCWAPVEGYSAFGSYVGNGSATSGPFVYTGFRPKWIMTKRTDSTAFWMVLDSKRDTYNVIDGQLYPNANNAEGSSAVADFLSNGFKARSTSNEMNTSGGTYVWAAFAESPFAYARAR